MGLGGDERKHCFMSIGERIGKTAAQDHNSRSREIERHNHSVRTFQDVSSMFICHRGFHQSPKPEFIVIIDVLLSLFPDLNKRPMASHRSSQTGFSCIR